MEELRLLVVVSSYCEVSAALFSIIMSMIYPNGDGAVIELHFVLSDRFHVSREYAVVECHVLCNGGSTVGIRSSVLGHRLKKANLGPKDQTLQIIRRRTSKSPSLVQQ
jgi:hypothetical protein